MAPEFTVSKAARARLGMLAARLGPQVDASTGLKISDQKAPPKDRKAHEKTRFFRIRVQAGGCAGFEYQFSWDDAPETEDCVLSQIERHDACEFFEKSPPPISVICDTASAVFLENCTLDFSDELIGSRFLIQNPAATAACGCGKSFSPF